MKYPSRIQWGVIWGTALVTFWMWIERTPLGAFAVAVAGALVAWMLSDTRKLREEVLDLDGTSHRARQLWDRFGARKIWTAAGVIFLSGLLLLSLGDLNYPSVAEQDRVIARQEAARAKACSEALADVRRQARAAGQKGYRLTLPSRVKELCAPSQDRAEPRREEARRRLGTYLLVWMGIAGVLVLWQSVGRPKLG